MLKFKKKDFIKLGLLILPLLILLAIFLFKSNFFTIKKINIKSKDLSCVSNSQIKSSLNLFGKNIFLINFQNQENILKSKYFCIKSVSFSRNLPDKLELRLESRLAKLIIIALKLKEASGSAIEQLIDTPATQSGQILETFEKYVSDDEGVIFDKDSGINLPRVYISLKELSIGKNLDKVLINNLLKIADKLKIFAINGNEFILEKENLILSNALPKIIFKMNSEIDNQLAALQLILENAKIGDKEIEFIDLRFDKPIVRYGQRQSNLRN